MVDGSRLEDAVLKSDANGQVFHVNLLNRVNSGKFVATIGTPSQGGSPYKIAIPSLSQRRYQKALERYRTIFPLLKLPGRTSLEVRRAAARANVTSRALYHWISRYNQSGFRGLVTPDTLGGKGRPRTDRKAEAILEQLIQSEYAQNPCRKSAFYQNLRAECYKYGVRKVPSSKTVYRRLRNIDRKIRVERLLGPRDSGRERMLWRGGFADGESPLQTIQIDDHKLDILVLDDETGEEIGRPWLTAGIDVYSRCIWGYYLGLQSNASTVGLMLINGCFNKRQLVETYHLVDWPVHGIPSQIHTDNGKNLVAEPIERGCVANGINVMRRPIHTPEYGPHIERFFGTLETEFVHTLPGTTFSNVREKGDYDSSGKASLTMKGLEKLLLDYIVKQYHNSFHRGLQTSPLEKWKEGLEGKDRGYPIAPIEPEDPKRFRQDFLPLVGPDGKRKVESDGVHFMGLVYWADELRGLQYDNGLERSYLVKYDPADMRFLGIYDDPNDRYYDLILNSRPPPFSLHELESARKQARSESGREPTEDLVIETILKRRQYVASVTKEGKGMRRRAASARREEESRIRLGVLPTGGSGPSATPHSEDYVPEPASKIMLSLEEEEDGR